MAWIWQRGSTWWVGYRRNGKEWRKAAGPTREIAEVVRKKIEFELAKEQIDRIGINSSTEELVGHVYYIHCKASGLLKIGFTLGAPKERLEGLQGGSPTKLKLLGSFRAKRSDEARLHQELAKHRQHGEWFTAGHEVMATLHREREAARTERRRLAKVASETRRIRLEQIGMTS